MPDAAIDSSSERVLDMARRIEHTVALVRQVRSRYKGSPWPRTRKRLRRQLRRLVDHLQGLQEQSLAAEPLTGDARGPLYERLTGIDELLRASLYHDLSKEELQDLRRRVKAQRLLLDSASHG